MGYTPQTYGARTGARPILTPDMENETENWMTNRITLIFSTGKFVSIGTGEKNDGTAKQLSHSQECVKIKTSKNTNLYCKRAVFWKNNWLKCRVCPKLPSLMPNTFFGSESEPKKPEGFRWRNEKSQPVGLTERYLWRTKQLHQFDVFLGIHLFKRSFF